MKRGTILHIQKVAGISGSEAHLLSLLPELRARDWDVRLLMLHENEPGAWDFARALTERGVPLETIRLRRDVDPIAFFQLVGLLLRMRPRVVHTHLVHADAYGQMAGLLAGVPLRVSTKHGFNEFRESRFFAVADRSVAQLAHVHIAISHGLASYLAQTEGFADVLPPRDRAQRRALLSLGFLPGPLSVDFIARPLAEDVTISHDPADWHVALGDTDFF